MHSIVVLGSFCSHCKMLSAFQFTCKAFARYKKFTGTSIIYSHFAEKARIASSCENCKRAATQDL
jgi:hypothetical protein